MPQPRRGGLEHDRVADLVRRRDGRVGVGDRPGAQQRHAVGGEQRDQLVVGERPGRPARPRSTARTTVAARRPRRRRAARARSPTGRRRQRAYSATFASAITARSGRRVGRDRAARRACRRSSRTASSGGMPSVDRKLATIGLAEPRGDVAQRRPELRRPGHERRQEDRDDRVDAVVVHGLPAARRGSPRACRRRRCRPAPRRPAPAPPPGRRRRPARPWRWSCRRSATRSPAGSGWWASSVPTSNSCATVSTRMTPAEANSAATDCSGTATDVPASPGVTRTCRPLFTATTGLVRPTRAGQPGELAGVAEALQVQQHDLGAGVGRPVLEQVVAADVGPVARRDEGGQADVAAARPLEQGDARARRTGRRSRPARGRGPSAPGWR